MRRRYPAQLVRRRAAAATPSEPTHADVLVALRSLDSFIDITEDDLRRLFDVLSLSRDASSLGAPIDSPLPRMTPTAP